MYHWIHQNYYRNSFYWQLFKWIQCNPVVSSTMAEVNESSNTIQFSISKLSKLTKVHPRKVSLYGIPWQVEVRKKQNGTQNSLGIGLHCPNKDESSNWTATACASIKLLTFSNDQPAMERNISPFVLNEYNRSISRLIQWDDLLNEQKKYVKDDAIKLKIKIGAENPNDVNRRIFKFLANFQVTVVNVSNLMAIRSPEFLMRGMPWVL